jgi:hypothetical protein
VEWDSAGTVTSNSLDLNLIDVLRLVSFVLGHFRMNVNEAIDTLLDVASSIFPEDLQQPPDLEINTRNLKEAIEGVLHRREIPIETKMNDPNHPPTRCKVYVSSMPIPFHISFLEGLYMPQRQPASTTLKHFVPIPLAGRVSTRPLSMHSVPQCPFHPTFCR